jgi:hypothetical protein
MTNPERDLKKNAAKVAEDISGHPQSTISKNTYHRDRQEIPSVSLIEFTSGSRGALHLIESPRFMKRTTQACADLAEHRLLVFVRNPDLNRAPVPQTEKRVAAGIFPRANRSVRGQE